MKEKIKKILLACLVVVVLISSVFLACYSNNKSKTDKSVERATLRSNKAITTKEDLIGTWVFKDNFVEISDINETYNIKFKSNNEEFDALLNQLTRGLIAYKKLGLDEHVITWRNNWSNLNYKTIEITDISQLTNELEFIAFMNTYADKQGETPPTPTKKPIITNYYLTANIKLTGGGERELYFDNLDNTISFTPKGTKVANNPIPYNNDINELKLTDLNQFDSEIIIKDPSEWSIKVVPSGQTAKLFTYTYKDVDFVAFNFITYDVETRVIERDTDIEVMNIFNLSNANFRSQFATNNLNSPKGIASGFIAIAMLPFTIIQSIFGDISLFGVKLKALFIGILVIGLVVWVVQRVKIPDDTGSSGGKGGRK